MVALVQVGKLINEELTPFKLAVVVEDSPPKKSPAKKRSTENNSEQPVKSKAKTVIKGTLGATESQGSQEEYTKALLSEEFVMQKYGKEYTYLSYGEKQPVNCKAKTMTKGTLGTTESQGSDEEHVKVFLGEDWTIQEYSKEYIYVPYCELPSLSETDKNETCMEATSERERDEEQSDTTAMSNNETIPVPVADCDLEDNKSGYVKKVDAEECKSSNMKDSQAKDRNRSDKDETTSANESDICKEPKSFSKEEPKCVTQCIEGTSDKEGNIYSSGQIPEEDNEETTEEKSSVMDIQAKEFNKSDKDEATSANQSDTTLYQYQRRDD